MSVQSDAVHPLSGQRPWILGGLAALLVLVGLGLYFFDRGRKQAPHGAKMELSGAQAGVGRKLGDTTQGATGPAAQEDARRPDFESTTCWRNLDAFNEGVTIETFRKWAAALLASEDEHVLTYLKERLAELIGADGGRATEVLGWVGDASPREAGVFLSALRSSEAVQLPAVAGQLTAMSLDRSLPLERRAGLLAALDTQKHFDAATLGRLTEVARDASSGEAGWAATRTIGRVLESDYKRSGAQAAYLDKLLTVGSESTDDDIRYLAISMPMHADPILDRSAIDRYAKILTTEGSANGRDAAAHMLSLSQDKARVLGIFASAFRADVDVCARWAMFRFAARAAGKEALPVMADMASVDPRFQDDYRSFEQIYASGVVDFDRVWLSLPDQDPHGCLHRPD